MQVIHRFKVTVGAVPACILLPEDARISNLVPSRSKPGTFSVYYITSKPEECVPRFFVFVRTGQNLTDDAKLILSAGPVHLIEVAEISAGFYVPETSAA